MMDERLADPERGESITQKADRNWDELLQETRVTQTGIQILFGFLLILPFQRRFVDLDQVHVALYVVVVALVIVSTVLNLTPVISHRILFRTRRKPQLVELGNRLIIASLMLLGLALTGAVALIVDVAVGRPWGLAFGIGVLALVIALWIITPVAMRRNGHGSSDAPPEGTGSRPEQEGHPGS